MVCVAGDITLQAALLLAGLLGIFVYKEITERRKIIGFFIASCGLLIGAALLAVFGACTTN